MFAAGSEARSLPGVEFDGKVILGNREILELPEVPKSLVDRGGRRGGRGVRLDLSVVRQPRSPSRDASAHRAARGRRDFRRTGEGLPQARHPDFPGGQGRVGARKSARAPRWPSATSRPGADAVGRARADGRGARARSRAIWVWTRRARNSSADSCTSGRSWRPTSRMSTPSAISSRACRNWRTPLPWKASSRSDKITGKQVPAARAQAHSQRHLLRAADRLDRADRAAGARGGLRREDREVSVPRQQQGFDPESPRGFRQGGGRGEKRRAARRAHHRSAGHGDSGRAGHGAATGSHRRRHDVHGARASDALGGHGRRLRVGARSGDHISERWALPHLTNMAAQSKICRVVDLGRIGYAEAFALQQRLVAARKAGAAPDVLLLCEHPHVLTLGRSGKLETFARFRRSAAADGRRVSSQQSRRRYHLSWAGADRRLPDLATGGNSPRCRLVCAPTRRGHDSSDGQLRHRLHSACRDARGSGPARRRPSPRRMAQQRGGREARALSACTSAAGSLRTASPTTFRAICAIST